MGAWQALASWIGGLRRPSGRLSSPSVAPELEKSAHERRWQKVPPRDFLNLPVASPNAAPKADEGAARLQDLSPRIFSSVPLHWLAKPLGDTLQL
jgi:hypothetical protein